MRRRCLAFINLTMWLGALAQLGERLLCKHQVIGSIPIGSTIPRFPEMKTQDPGATASGMGRNGLFDIVNGFLKSMP